METRDNDNLRQLFDNLEIGIGGVSSSLGLSQRQLRYWEQKGYIKPVDEDSGVRHYSLSTVYLIAFIKTQLDKGYTLEAAVKKSKEVKARTDIIRRLMRTVFDQIKITNPDKGYGEIKFNVKVTPDNEPMSLLGIVDENGSYFEVKKDQNKKTETPK
jgi:hypothetical protein